MRYYSEKYKLERGTDHAAGYDLPYYDHKRQNTLKLSVLYKWGRWFATRKLILPFVRYKLPTGIYAEIPEGHYGEIDSRSSTSKKMLLPLCRTIDADYRGNIHVVFVRLLPWPTIIRMGEKRFQMVVKPYYTEDAEKVDHRSHLSHTVRGNKGFGSTDK